MAFNDYTGGRFVIRRTNPVTFRMGPFMDENDGKTVLTGLTISNSDVRLSKNDGAFGAMAGAAAITHDENGWYVVTLASADTGTQGNLLVAIHMTGALPVWRFFEVDDAGPS